MEARTLEGDKPGPFPDAPRAPVVLLSLGIAGSAALYVAMAAMAGWPAFVRSVASIPEILWGQVVGLSLVSYLARFIRWHRFLTALGHRIPVRRNLEIYLSGFALTMTPGKVGETIRSAYVQRYGVSYPASIGAFVAERLLDLVVVGLLACLALLVLPEHGPWMVGVASCCLMGALLFRSRLLSWLTACLAERSSGRHAAAGIDTVRFLLSGRRLAEAVPLSFVAWTAQGLALYLILDSWGYAFTPPALVGIYGLSLLAGAASFIPGGLGATEAAMALLLAAAGVSAGDSVAASLVCRGFTLWLAVGLGVLAMSQLAFRGRRGC